MFTEGLVFVIEEVLRAADLDQFRQWLTAFESLIRQGEEIIIGALELFLGSEGNLAFLSVPFVFEPVHNIRHPGHTTCEAEFLGLAQRHLQGAVAAHGQPRHEIVLPFRAHMEEALHDGRQFFADKGPIAIGGSAMWELFMEREYPSTNDIIATPVGGAALGEVFYRTSDLLLDDRTTGGRRFGRELAAFLVSPMRGVNRVLTGQAWKKRTERGREFNDKPLHLELSVGTRILAYHDQDHLTKGGASARFNMEYGDRFNHDSKVPYDYFSFLAEFNLMKTQPLLSRIEIMGRLLSKDIVQTRHCDLSVGLFQHFDFFDSDTISLHTPASFSPCTIPYKLGTPASVGAGAMFRYQNDHGHLDMEGHANGVLLGGILSDYYRYYHRNYNWAMGFSFKSGLNGYFLDDRLSFSFHHQFYRFYTRDTWNDETPWSETPGGKPVNVQGDDSVANFHHLEGQLNYKIWKKLFLSGRMDFYHRSTRYRGGMYWQDNYMSNWYVDSKQLSFQLMLSFLL